MSDEKNENLRAAYQQLCESYRAIDDFRTKLLGFLTGRTIPSDARSAQ